MADMSMERPELVFIGTPFGASKAATLSSALEPEVDTKIRLVTVSTLREQREPSPVPDAGDAVDGGVGDDYRGEAEPEIAEQAREAALAFDLVLAAELWRRAADELIASESVVFFPERVARTLLEAGAASVAAGERDLALDYFRKAIAIDGDVSPGPEISPDATDLFEKGRALGPALLSIPKDEVLEKISAALGVDGLVWVATGRDGGQWVVSFKLYISGETSSELETRRYPMSFSDKTAKSERHRFGGIIARKLLGAALIIEPTVRIRPLETVVSKPWYRKWWVYVIGGALIAGGAAGVATWWALQPKETTVTVQY